ncbi:MAG: aldehyde dehydrogenase family protein [Arenicella sp.]
MTQQKHSLLASMSDLNVEQLVDIASNAFDTWSEMPISKRVGIMRTFGDLLKANTDKLVSILTREKGCSTSDARDEILKGIRFVESACDIVHLWQGDLAMQLSEAEDQGFEHHALGVVAGVLPVNQPIMISLWMYPVALVCGNTFILKSSPETPVTLQYIAELLHDSGLPSGVFNMFYGEQQTVSELLDNPCVKALSFVGSSMDCELILAKGFGQAKKVQVCSAMKAYVLVMPDADIKQVVDAVFDFLQEPDMASPVIIAVGEQVGNNLVMALARRLHTSSGLSMKPMIDANTLIRTHGYIYQATEKGAELIVDDQLLNARLSEGSVGTGTCLLDFVTADMAIYYKDVFGPVLIVARAESVNNALNMINVNDAYCHAMAVFSKNKKQAVQDLGELMQMGEVSVNGPIPVTYSLACCWFQPLFDERSFHAIQGIRFNAEMVPV